MTGFLPDQLAADAAGTWQGPAPRPVTGVAIDSRTVGAGELFVALQTARRDGHDFVAAAAERGAAAALVARFQPEIPLPQLVVADPLHALQALAHAQRARFSGPVVGVTGSAGKTSTKDLLAVLLGGGGVLATEGNLNNHLGVPLTLLRLDPDRHQRAVIEAGISGPGEMDVIARLIAADVAIITLVAAAHLDGLRSLEGVAAEKARLAAHRRSGGVAIMPASCLAFPAFRELAPPLLVAVPHGTAPPALPSGAHLVPFAVCQEGPGTSVSLTWHGAVDTYAFRRLSTGMAGNAVLALAAALHLGVDPDELRARLPQWRPAALRGEVRRDGDRTLYLDCYNANPASMQDAVEAFVALAPAGVPRLFVVGCMEELGEATAALHRAVGARWPLGAGDRLIVFGAQADAFASGVREAVPGADVLVNPPRNDAARLVRTATGAVFLKGSRRYALETLCEGGVNPPDAHPHRVEVAA